LLVDVLPARVQVAAGLPQPARLARDQPGPVEQPPYAAAVQRRGEGHDGGEAVVPGVSVAGNGQRGAIEGYHAAQRVADHAQLSLGRQGPAVEVQTAGHRLGHVDQWPARVGWPVCGRAPAAVELGASEGAFEEISPAVVAATFGEK